jgi:hypothetical protein
LCILINILYCDICVLLWSLICNDNNTFVNWYLQQLVAAAGYPLFGNVKSELDIERTYCTKKVCYGSEITDIVTCAVQQNDFRCGASDYNHEYGRQQSRSNHLSVWTCRWKDGVFIFYERRTHHFYRGEWREHGCSATRA